MSADLFSLQGKTALVTGGSRGLGLSIAQGFLLAGAATVVISSRKSKACEEAVAELNALCRQKDLPGTALFIAADLGSHRGVEELLAGYQKLALRLDILVANAGATWGADLENHPESAIEKVLALNVKGVFSTVQLFYPLLAESGSEDDPARVLVTGSVAGIITGLSGGTYGYIASKAAVHHLSKSLAVELGPSNITVNVLAPGFFPTKMSEGLLSVIGEEAASSNPRGRLGKPDDIIGAAIYLCSRAGTYINGVVLPIDGGAHLTGKL